MKIGLISDTHGYLDPRVANLFAGVQMILHAGDVGSLAVVEELSAIATVNAVRGNIDEGQEAGRLPLTVDLEMGGLTLHLVHQLNHKRLPAADVVVFGHSHRVHNAEVEGRLLVNPGAAGKRGFHRVFSVGILDITDGEASARIMEFGSRVPRPEAESKEDHGIDQTLPA